MRHWDDFVISQPCVPSHLADMCGVGQFIYSEINIFRICAIFIQLIHSISSYEIKCEIITPTLNLVRHTIFFNLRHIKRFNILNT